ncbi:translation initiation factor eIF-2B subunit beta [Tetranychus urticae]|uniref:Translation initiation factor eIF2B subunit beta n=1 Tax=Tetranychus urticae TaxID=32264 RepID=T1KJ52_TETUR|nr:translation initiation factor eIF-2B subunit beta [Tetranychus urticae]
MDKLSEDKIAEIRSVTQVDKLVEDLKLGKVNGCYLKAFRTMDLLEKGVKGCAWNSAQDLISIFTCIGDLLSKADPIETVPTNIVLRVLKGIRDEYVTASSKNPGDKSIGFDTEESLPKMMISDDLATHDYAQPFKDLKENIIDYLSELDSELEASVENIASKSLEQISSGQVILTAGKSKSVEAFLKYAAKYMTFQVFVAESEPSGNGTELAMKLAEAGINTILIPDSAIFAIMPRVNKVIIGTHSVMANGGLKAVSGSYALAYAAKNHSVPLTVCTPIFKITPNYLISHDQVAFNKFVSPHQILPFHESPFSTETEVVNPVFDYVPPELVNGFVTNWGCYTPSYVYRLLSELYHRRDYLS